MRTSRLLLIVAAGILGALSVPLSAPSPALAHNQLTGSDPADVATVERAPERMRLTFRASLDPLNSRFTVTVPGGSSTPVEEPTIKARKATVPIPAGPAGEYQVGYEVLSSDGDWVDGTVTFTATAASEPATTPSPERAHAVITATVTEEEPSGGGGWWPWLVAAAALVAVVGYGGYRLLRRRTTG